MRLGILAAAIVLVGGGLASAADVPLATLRNQWLAARGECAAAVRKSQLLRQEGSALEQEMSDIRGAIESAAAPTPPRLRERYRDKQAEIAAWQRRFAAVLSELSGSRRRERMLLAELERTASPVLQKAQQGISKKVDDINKGIDALGLGLPPPTPPPTKGITSMPRPESAAKPDAPLTGDLSSFANDPATPKPPAAPPKP